ncbi:MAG: hypothetical protein IT381_15240 [Deltaproteobacteria bacterium]|nr:hypothetical protein [Deltaproteobacteria bacterium]
MRRALLFSIVLSGCAASSATALDSAVMAYDRTTVHLISKLLLLNIARAHRDLPTHFTTVSSIAATYDFRFNAGVGPAATGDFGWLPMPSIGGSTGENPTITITPMQGDEFTQRLLTPFDERKVTMLLRQGYDVDALLRLMTEQIAVREGDKTIAADNRPANKEGYTLFRRLVAHLSSIQDRHALHVDALAMQLPRTIPAGASEDLHAVADDPSLTYDPDKQVYRVNARVVGRVIVCNYDPETLAADARIALQEEARRLAASEILVDVRADHPGGEYPIHGVIRLRSFMNVLTFLGRDIAAEPEYDVAPDPRTKAISENPTHTLDILEATGAPSGSDLHVALDGKIYALAPEQGYQWNKKVFSLLYQLFQMSVAPATQPSPLITIAK